MSSNRSFRIGSILVPLIAAALTAGVVNSAHADPVQPDIFGPVAQTSETHLWSSMQRARVPFDVSDYGFVEEEFFLSGQSNIYENAADGVKAVGQADYINNILVRRPSDLDKFSGVVLVDVLNASNGFPGEDHWRRMWQWALDEGHAVIGLTSKPIQIDALHNYDADRYADLTWDLDPDAAREPIIADPKDPAGFNPHMVVPGAEEGLVWDIITQLGVVLDGDQAGKILGGMTPETAILMGQSQSGVYVRTYVNRFHQVQEDAAGHSVWDGYLITVGGSMERPLTQTDEGGLTFEPPAPASHGVPLISVSAEGDALLFGFDQLAERELQTNEYEWQVPGAPHTDLLSSVIPADSEIYQAGRLPNLDVQDEEFREAVSLYPIEPAVVAAAQALIDWNQDGRRPGASLWLEQDNGAFVTNDAGNVAGGLTYGLFEYPLGEYSGAAEPGAVYGSMELMSKEEFAKAYGTREQYLAKIRAFDETRLQEGYLTPWGAEYLEDVANRLLDRMGVPMGDESPPMPPATGD